MQINTENSCHQKRTKQSYILGVTRLLGDGTSGNNFLSSLISVLLEVLVEELGEFGDLVSKASRGSPALLRIEQLVGNTGAGFGDVEVEDGVYFVLSLGEFTIVDGIQDGTSVFQWATLTTGGSAGTNPTSVEQPGIGLVLGDLVCKHLCVAHGVESKEGLGEARGEGSLGLGDTVLSTGHLGGVTGDEVEHCLLSGELRNGGKDTTSIASQKDDVCGVVFGEARNLGVLNVLDGVGATSVLGQGSVVVVDNTSSGVEDDVLKDGTELDSVENIGFFLSGKTNALGVATTLDVEDTPVGPAVLIITNQSTLGVSGKSGLASTRKTKENSDITVLALVGRRVESQDIVLDRHLVEEDGEDTLLHFSGVFGTQNDHFLLGEVDSDGCSRGHTLCEAVSRERTGVVDDIVGVEVLELLGGGADQHVTHEQGMVGTGADDTDINAIALIPAGKTVDDVDTVPGVEVVDSTLSVDSPDL